MEVPILIQKLNLRNGPYTTDRVFDKYTLKKYFEYGGLLRENIQMRASRSYDNNISTDFVKIGQLLKAGQRSRLE